MKFIAIPFYDFTKPIITPKYDKNVAIQLPDGDFLINSEPYGLPGRVDKLDRFTGEVTTIYTHSTVLRLTPMEVLHDGNVILLAFDYPYNNHRLYRSTDPTLTNFEEVLYMGHTKPYSKHGISQGEDGTILCGEYIGSYAWNKPDANTECKVWKSDDNGSNWDVLYAFRRNNHADQFGDELMGNGIQHIHVIEYDKYTKSFWIGTGDSDRESSLWRWNESEGFNLIGRGYADGYEIDEGQYYRAISLEFYPDSVMWGMDGFLAGTWIVRYDRESGELTRTTEKRTDGYMFYSDTLRLKGGSDVSFFSGTSGTIYGSYDRHNSHVVQEFEGAHRTRYIHNKFDNEMLFTGQGDLKLDGEPIYTGSINFKARIIPLKFLSP